MQSYYRAERRILRDTRKASPCMLVLDGDGWYLSDDGGLTLILDEAKVFGGASEAMSFAAKLKWAGLLPAPLKECRRGLV